MTAASATKTSLIIKSEFALLQTLPRFFHLFQFAKCWHFFFWSSILKDCIEVQEKKKKVVLCSRPRQNVKLGPSTTLRNFLTVTKHSLPEFLLVIYLFLHSTRSEVWKGINGSKGAWERRGTTVWLSFSSLLPINHCVNTRSDWLRVRVLL